MSDPVRVGVDVECAFCPWRRQWRAPDPLPDEATVLGALRRHLHDAHGQEHAELVPGELAHDGT